MALRYYICIMAGESNNVLESTLDRLWRRNHRMERRHEKDSLLFILTGLGYINMIIVVVAGMLLAEAKPDTFHSMYKGLPLKYYWEPEVLRHLFSLAILGFFLASAGLVINSQRLKRKVDSIRINLVFLWVGSGAGIIAYLSAI